MDNLSDWRRNGRRAAMFVAVVIFLGVIAQLRGALEWGKFWDSVNAWRWTFVTDAALLIVAAWQWRRNQMRMLAGVALAWGGAVLLLGLYDQVSLLRGYPQAADIAHLNGVLFNYGSLPARTLLMVMVVFAFTLKRWGSVAQYVSAGCMLLISLLEMATYNMTPSAGTHFAWQAIGPVGLLGVVSLLVVVYHVLYKPYHFPADQPPHDAGRVILLTCPRCGSGQQIPSGGGACENCKLKIYIALDEGRCATCGYRLRGLTGKTCPECGTRIEAAASGSITVEAPSPQNV